MKAEITVWLLRTAAATVMGLGLSVVPTSCAPQRMWAEALPAVDHGTHPEPLLLMVRQDEANTAADEWAKAWAAMPDAEKVRGDAEAYR